MQNRPDAFPFTNIKFDPESDPFFESRNLFFDLGFGVVLPIVGLIIDPVLFRNWLFCGSDSIVTPYANFAYGAIGLCMLTLTVWIVSGGKLNWGLGWVAGILLTGGCFALAGAILLIPTVIQGLPLLCMGLIGLFPFITGFVYFRNGTRAMRRHIRQNPSHSPARMMGGMFAGVLLVIGLGVVIQSSFPAAAQSMSSNRNMQLLCRSSNE